MLREDKGATGALRLPPVTFSCSHEHADFAGMVSVSATTLAAIVNDVAESLERQGIRRLLIVNGHGGNYVLANLVQQAIVQTRDRAAQSAPLPAPPTPTRAE